MDNFHGKGDFELLKVDILRSSVNGIPSIHLSKWVNQILIKNMACTVVIKLLGRSIGYSTLYNKHYDHVKEFCPNKMNRQKEIEKGDTNERRGWRPSKIVKGNDDEVLRVSGHHRLAQREGLCKYRREGNKGVGLERVMSGGEGLNELIARVTELKDSHLVQGGGAPREA
ncbi:hypothetical protein Godav_014858 [Gossypium davidsonii]|uniref:Uncharacterized protein n=1 Tax=Gossypium davidsonii TaxID=34287 RepID=A0A7J8RLE0_GOSDV|nr:hypothetical protein [Gossypium davidsonii]